MSDELNIKALKHNPIFNDITNFTKEIETSEIIKKILINDMV